MVLDLEAGIDNYLFMTKQELLHALAVVKVSKNGINNEVIEESPVVEEQVLEILGDVSESPVVTTEDEEVAVAVEESVISGTSVAEEEITANDSDAVAEGESVVDVGTVFQRKSVVV